MTDTLGYELLKRLSVYSYGRAPSSFPQSWVYPLDLASQAIVPTPTDGIDTSEAIVADVGVLLNWTPGEFRGWLRIDNHSDANPYGVEFFGSGVGSFGIQGATAGTVAAIVANVLADFASNFTIGTAALADGETDIIEWVIPRTEPEYRPPYDPPDLFIGAGTLVDSILSDAAGYAALQSSIVEASEVYWRVWGVPNGKSEFVLRDDIPMQASRGPLGAKRICVAGYDRTFVEVVSADGTCIGFVSPGYLDPDDATKAEQSVTAWENAASTRYLFGTSEQGRELPENRASATTFGAQAPEIRNQGVVTVSSVTPTRILNPNPARKGFALYNLDGANTAWTKWIPTRSTTNSAPAVGDGWPLKADLIRTGVDVPGNALDGLAETADVDVWFEEW